MKTFHPFVNRLLTLWLLMIVTIALATDWQTQSTVADEKPAQPPPATIPPATKVLPPDAIDRDYADQLPRLPAKEPSEALKTFTVAPGFEMQLVAAEPLVTDPIALAFDESGGMYVVEMGGYSENREDKLSRIRYLQDTNGDGVYDASQIFADGLKWPTAVAVWKGGVLVIDAPDLFYLKDTSGDGKADRASPEEWQTAFTGFGFSNVQGLANSLNWGLDNKIYGATSSSGADLVSHLVRYNPKEREQSPLPLRGRDFAIDPLNWRVTAVTGGAQHGLSMNDWGERFICHNSDHIIQVLLEDQDLVANPIVTLPPVKQSIAADGPQADVYRTSPVEPWRIVRTRLRAQGITPGLVEGGGRAAGFFTSATGVTIYRGNAWPAEFNGLAIVGDVGSNIIHRKRLTGEGILYQATRMDEKSELVSSSDTWFRPVQFANGPDGSLYICDMYRETIEHPASIPPVIKKHVDLTSGRDRGRIYRLVPTGFQQPKLPNMAKLTTAELVPMLDYPNSWQRETAARLIYERQVTAIVPQLEKLSAEGKTPQGRILALYALSGLNRLTDQVVLGRLADEHPRVRQQAIKLTRQLKTLSPALVTKYKSLAHDADLHVRFQLALSAGSLESSEDVATTLKELALYDSTDPYLRAAILTSASGNMGRLLAELLGEEKYRRSSAGMELLKLLALGVARSSATEFDLAIVPLAALSKAPADAALFQALVEALALKPESPLAQKLAAASAGKTDELLKNMVLEAEKTVLEPTGDLPARVAAAQTLRMGKFEALQETFAKLLEPTQPVDLQSRTLATLGSFDSPAVATLLLERYPALSPRLKAQAADLLVSRSPFSAQLIAAVEQEKLSTAEIDPTRWKQLAETGDEDLRKRAAAILAKTASPQVEELLARYRPFLDKPADAARGQAAFKKVCAACHKIQGVGHELGPNLVAMRNKGADAILLNVLAPNREVNPQYLSYTAVLNDGRVLNGMITSETASSVTLTRAENASDTILRSELDRLQSSGRSLMPEGMEKQVDPQMMVDVIEYLKSLP